MQKSFEKFEFRFDHTSGYMKLAVLEGLKI